jgi:hypothetical protein
VLERKKRLLGKEGEEHEIFSLEQTVTQWEEVNEKKKSWWDGSLAVLRAVPI